jgi:hypothetical protein
MAAERAKSTVQPAPEQVPRPAPTDREVVVRVIDFMNIHRPLHQSKAISGACAGGMTTVIFAAVHHALISDIWFSLVPMLVMGAICGASLAWSYTVMFRVPALSTWLLYNAAYLLSLVLLGIASFVVYDPIATTAALIAASESPRDLIARAFPLTVLFWLGSTGVISLLWGRGLRQITAMLVTSGIIIGLFGLNISVIGLVKFNRDGVYLIGVFFGLIAAIIGGNAMIFAVMERGGLFRPGVPTGGARDTAQEPAIGCPE